MASSKKNSRVEVVTNVEKNVSFQRQEELFKVWGDIEYYAQKYCKVWIKEDAKYGPFLLMPTQKKVLDGFETYDKNLVLKYRQGGISTVTELYISHILISTPDIKVGVVANTKELAKKFLKETTDFIENLPDEIKINTKKKASDYKIFMNNAEIKAFAATPDGIRGFSPDILVIDEAAYLDKGYEFYTSARGSLSAGGKIIMISTPSGLDDLYYATYAGAINGKNDFNVIEIKWWQDIRFNKDLSFKFNEETEQIKDVWIIKKDGRKVLDLEKCFNLISKGYKATSPWFEKQCAGYDYDTRRINQELLNAFLGSGGNMIDEKSIMEQENKNVKIPDIQEYRDKNFWIWVNPKPDARYVMGVDVSNGNSEDYSSIVIIDIDTGEQVAEYQGRIPKEDLGQLVFEYAVLYNQAFVVMDITGGSGSVPMLILLERGYKNVYYTENTNKAIREKLEDYLDNDGKIPGFIISNNRSLILQDFEKLVRLNEFIIRSSRMISEIKTFVWNATKGRFDHMRSSHDDCLMAAAMAFAGLAKYNQNKMDGAEAARMAALWSIGTPVQHSGQIPTSSHPSANVQPIIPTNPNAQYNSFFGNNGQYQSELEKYTKIFQRGL